MSDKLPLLIKGFFENPNQSNPTVVGLPGTVQRWSNQIQEGRGDVEMIDVISTNLITQDGTPGGTFNVGISAYTILENQVINRYYYNSYPRSYELVMLRQPPGQTINLQLDSAAGAGAVVHCYHTNKFLNEKVINARKTAMLKQKVMDFQFAPIAFGQRIDETATITVPQSLGNVVAVEINTYNDAPAVDCVQSSLLSMQVDGINIIDNAAAITFYEGSTRPGLVFPMVIRPGNTFKMFANTINATSGNMIINVRLYFDDDVAGKVVYA